ncbi:cohesin loading factor [Halenospora varia]|nr:cohesin loading factor [Halenospora varia]
MSYQGGPAPGNGFWTGHDPPDTINPQATRPQYLPNPQTPYPTPMHHPQLPNVQHQQSAPEYARRGYYTPPTIQPQALQSQYIQPSQLFQQPTAQPAQLNPLALGPKVAAPTTFKHSARMAPSPTDNQSDRSMLLLSLAEEYFDAAHQLAPSVSLAMTSNNVESYEHLIATGLGCLEAALKWGRLQPRQDANVRLRYASVLYEETENYMEAEVTLNRGIALCERNHYFDLKYSMQYLLAQIMSKKSPKASMKVLDGYIAEAEAYKHFSWVYALRFLRASYALESGNPTDNHVAIHNLQKISDLASMSKQNDRAIHLTASLMEAMVQLKSAGPDSVEHVQRAIAAARMHQLDVGRTIPQLNALSHIIDVMCSIRQRDFPQMYAKLKDLQGLMDSSIDDPAWSSDVIAIPINRTPSSSQTVSHETRSVLGIGPDGGDNLMMSFLQPRDVYAISYLLAGVVLLHRHPNEDKGFKFLQNGLGFLESDTKICKPRSGILPDLVSKQKWRGLVLCYFRLYLAFNASALSDWKNVKRNVDQVEATAKRFEITVEGPLKSLAKYLAGVYHQGSGDTETALKIFQDQTFELLQPKSNPSSSDQVERDLSLLATINSLWILQEPNRKNVDHNTALIAKLEPYCKRHPNKDIQIAFNIVLASVVTNPPLQHFAVRAHLGLAMEMVKTTANSQLTSILLSIMCSRFFVTTISDQAEKSAIAAARGALKNGNALWRSVADGLLAHNLELQGKSAEAQGALDRALKLARIALPDR